LGQFSLFVENWRRFTRCKFGGAAYALAAGVTVLLIGRMSDTVKENELLVVAGYLIMAVGFISYIWVDSVVKLLISQLIVGFGEAVYSPAFDALYSKHLDKHQAGVEWGLWESMRYFMLAGGAVLGGVIVNVFDFNVLFIVMGIMSAASGLYILLPRRML
jgi:predicted MFS family arabinose efflux permease